MILIYVFNRRKYETEQFIGVSGPYSSNIHSCKTVLSCGYMEVKIYYYDFIFPEIFYILLLLDLNELLFNFKLYPVQHASCIEGEDRGSHVTC